MAQGIVDQLLGQLDKANVDYVSQGYKALVTNCSSMMITIMTIYIAWIGWKTINHWDGFSAGAFVKETLKVAVVYSLATDWDFFSQYLYNLLTNGPNELSMYLMKSAGSHYDSTNSALNALFQQGLDTGSRMWEKSGFWSGVLGCVFAIDIWICTIVAVGVAVIIIGVAKAFLAILIVMTPIFVFFLLSNSFKAITESWFKMMLGFSLVPLFVNSALLYTNDMLKKGIDTIADSLDKAHVVDAITAIAVFDISVLLCGILLWKSADLAAQIGGGIAINGLDQIASMVSGTSSVKSDRSKEGRFDRKPSEEPIIIMNPGPHPRGTDENSGDKDKRIPPASDSGNSVPRDLTIEDLKPSSDGSKQSDTGATFDEKDVSNSVGSVAGDSTRRSSSLDRENASKSTDEIISAAGRKKPVLEKATLENATIGNTTEQTENKAGESDAAEGSIKSSSHEIFVDKSDSTKILERKNAIRDNAFKRTQNKLDGQSKNMQLIK